MTLTEHDQGLDGDMVDMSLVAWLRAEAHAEALELREEARADALAPAEKERGMRMLHVELGCPRCGSGWRIAARQKDRRGITARERRIIIACEGERCRWEGSLVVDVADLGMPS